MPEESEPFTHTSRTIKGPALRHLSALSFILKSWAKLVVRKLVIWTPLNLRRFVFIRLAESLNVPLIQVNGSIGSILGPTYDEGMLYPYLGHTIATDVITSYIEQFFSMNGNLGRFLDVGANIGLVTVPIAQNQAIQCKAFEPEPLNYQLLNWNINSNCRYDNVETYNIGVWRERTALVLELSPKDPGDHRIQGSQPSPERQKINIIGASLDEIVPSSWIQHPLVVKIDSQGSEVEIIRGGQVTISKTDLLVLEFWPTGISFFGSDLAWFFGYLGETFTRGALVPAGELNVRLGEASFRPIQDLISELRVFVQKSLPAQQVDLFLRRN